MRRTKTHQVIPWVGGINTSVDPGVLNDQELVLADNVVFAANGARVKRLALEYLDHDIPQPDFRSSSGTTRTLRWSTNTLINISPLDARLVVGERITVTGLTNYNVTDTPILSVNSFSEVTTVTCVADVSGSLASKYFLISAGDGGTDYYVWFKVSGSGTDPAIAGRTGIEVNIVTNDTASAVAAALNAIINAEADFNSTVLTSTVTVTAASAGYALDASAGNSGFTVTVTTQGGHSITYTGTSSLSESITAAGGITTARASSVIMVRDYWRWNGTSNTQLVVFATDDFQLFRLDDSGRRAQILGETQVETIVTTAASTITTGDYFFINSANDTIMYYVWYNKAGGGGDPAVSGRTGVEVAIGATDTAAQVATATAAALDALAAYSAVAVTTTVTVTYADSGITTPAVDVNTGFTFAVTTYGATTPTEPLTTIRNEVMNERLIMAFSGVGNYMIKYNPDENVRYQLLSPSAPDASFLFRHQGRLWANDKTDRDLLHYSETFDETLWGGLGDSGALPISPGDGDPEGLNNGYVYKGFAVVAKKAARFRVTGDSPENYDVLAISEGLGNEGAFYIPVDETDVVFMSRRGLHSQAATDAYGDTDSKYVSFKIKPTFTEDFNPARLKFSQGAYIPELNSIAVSIAERGDATQNDVWLYNLEAALPNGEVGAWYRWPDISCQALSRQFVDSEYKLIFGTSSGRVIRSNVTDSYADFGVDGIEFKVRTGTIYPGNDPHSIKAFKKISMIYRPRGNFSFTLKAYVDNSVAQSFAFTQNSGLDLLGETFILGTSLLGSSAGLAPFTFSMEGYGRGIILEITQPTPDEQVEVWGFIIEYESADTVQEVQ